MLDSFDRDICMDARAVITKKKLQQHVLLQPNARLPGRNATGDKDKDKLFADYYPLRGAREEMLTAEVVQHGLIEQYDLLKARTRLLGCCFCRRRRLAVLRFGCCH